MLARTALWHRATGRREISIESSLSVDAACHLLAADAVAESRFRPVLTLETTVRGTVAPEAVSLWVRRGLEHSSFAAVLDARFEALPDGCRLSGTVGLRPYVRWFIHVWGALATAFLCGGLAGAIGRAVDSGVGAAVELLPFVLIPVALTTFGAWLFSSGVRASRRDEEFLLAWVVARLDERTRSVGR